MNAELTAALDQLYEIFADYKESNGFAKQSGVTHSLRDLTRDDWDAMNVKFDMAVVLWQDEILRHFLPRFLEWNMNDSIIGWLDLWDIAHRLDRCGWLEWPTKEVEALRGVFGAWTREELSKYEGEMPMDFLIHIKDNLAPYLQIWLEIRPHEFAQWLWTVDWEKQEKVRFWLIEPHVGAALEAEFFAHPDGERARTLSRSIELIRSLRG